MLFHEFRHIQPNQRVHRVKQVVGKALDQFCLTDTGRTDENKGYRLSLGTDAHTVSANRPGNRIHRLVLTNNVLLQAVSQTFDLLILLCLNFACGNFGPQFDNPRQVFHSQRRCRNLFQFLNLIGQLAELATDGCQPLIMLIFRVLRQQPKLQFVVIPLFFLLRKQRNLLAAQIQIRAGFIQQIDGFIRQETVCDIPLRQHHALSGNLQRNGNTVKFRVTFRNALHNLAGFLDGGFIDCDRLETALQRRILFNVLAVLVEGRCANDLNLTPGQCRFQNIGSIHGAFRITGTHQVMHFVNHQNDVAAGFDFCNQALHPALKLAPELSTGNQSGQIQQKDFFIPQFIGYISRSNALGKAFGNGSFTHTRFADQAGIVLLPTVKNLDNALRLHIPANHLIQFARSGSTS